MKMLDHLTNSPLAPMAVFDLVVIGLVVATAIHDGIKAKWRLRPAEVSD